MSKLRKREYIGEERTYSSPKTRVDVSNLQNYLENIGGNLAVAKSSLEKFKSSERMTPQLKNVEQMLLAIQAGAKRALRRVEKLKEKM